MERFAITSTLFENDVTVIYRATLSENNRPVILKTHKRTEDAPKIIHEYNLLKGKTLSGVSNVIEMIDNGFDPIYLVTEDEGGVVLESFLREHRPLDGETLARIMFSAASSLEQIHSVGILHRDIKPSNMLINADTLDVSYIDFGISLSSEQESRNALAGTMEYISPEQTGRLGYSPDQRSDLYSLGVAMYYAAAGELPFHGKNAMELIHAHIAVAPRPLTELCDIPAILGKMIMKLLEKKPEKRYQSAESLVYDTERYLELGDPNASFLLGEQDIFSGLLSTKKLYGKEQPLRELLSAAERVDKDSAEVVLLSGPRGGGKSIVLSHMRRRLEEGNVLLFRAEFTEGEYADPYFALRAAFEHFEQTIYRSKVPVSFFRDQLVEQLGDATGILCALLPSLRPLLGLRQTARELASPMQVEQTFRRFLQILGSSPVPAIYIFDNIQWADAAVMNLLFAAMEGGGLVNSLFVFTHREDDDVNAKNLRLFLEKHRSRRLQMNKIRVHPLSVKDIAATIDDVLPQGADSAERLAELAHAYSQGNLRTLTIYLKDLYRCGALTYNEEEGRWHWDQGSADLAATANIDKQVYERIDLLAEDARWILLLVACIGREVTEEQLIAALGETITPVQAKRLLQPAMKLDLLRCIRSGIYEFDSTHIRQTVLASFSEEQQKQAHYQVGSNTYRYYKDDQSKLLFYCIAITEQFRYLDLDHIALEDRLLILELNMLAGDTAMDSSNPERALDYFQIAYTLLPENSFDTHYEQTLHVYGQYTAALFQTGQRERSMDLFHVMLEHARGEEKIYQIYRRMIREYHTVADWAGAGQLAQEYLAPSGLLPPEDPAALAEIIDRLRQETYALLDERGMDYFSVVSYCPDETLQRQGSMFAILSEAAVLCGKPESIYYLCMAGQIFLRHGAFSDVQMVFGVALDRIAEVRNFALCKQLFEAEISLCKRLGLTQSPVWAAYCNLLAHWVIPLNDIPELYRQAKNITLMEGHPYYSAFVDLMQLCYEAYTDVPLKQLNADAEAALYNADKYHLERFQLLFSACFCQYARCMTGKTNSPLTFDDRTFRESEVIARTEPGMWQYAAQIYYVMRMKALVFNGDFLQAIEQARRMEELVPNKSEWYSFITVVDFYYYRVLAYLRLSEQEEDTERYAAQIDADLERLEEVVSNNPDNFQPKLTLLKIGRRRIAGSEISLITEYSQVDREFKSLNCLWDQALIEESLIRFWQERNLPQYCENHMKNALKHYDALNAKLKVYELMGSSASTEHSPQTTVLSSTLYTYSDFSSTGVSGSSSLDYQTILEVIASLAGESRLEDMMDELLSVLMKNGGAEQAHLFLVEDGVASLRAFRYSDRNTRGFLAQDLPVLLSQINETVLPVRLIDLSIRRKQVLLATSSDNEYMFLGDVYLERNQPESFLLLPIITGGRFFGMVYLENAQLPGVFDRERRSFLSAIVMQAAILLQNAINMEAMAHYTEDLESRLNGHLKQLNTLIAGIAHEVNSPLGVCVTIATTLSEHTRNVERQYQERTLGKVALERYLEESLSAVDLLYNNVLRASDLVKNFKKIAVDQSNVIFEDLDLMQVIQDAWSYVRPAVKQQIGACRITGPAHIPIRTSNGVLAQIFTNMIMNSAIHAFTGRERENCQISIHVEDYASEVIITYHDNGRGMTKEECDQVFLPFYTTRRGEGGSGLGGHIILTLVTQTLHGTIQCTSRIGVGTTYTMKLPKNIREEGSYES